MGCFICKTSLTIQSMSKHFKLVHCLAEKDTYMCTFQNNCNQYFNYFSSLIRHVKSHLSRERNIGVKVLATVNIPNSLNDTNPSLPTHSASKPSVFDCLEIPNVNYNIPNISTVSTSQYSECGLQFSLNLHNNKNFTRNDVTDIQQNVMVNIVQPLISSVQQFIKANFSHNIEQDLHLSALIQKIQNPFSLCENEYKLLETLKKREHLGNFEQFTINCEIGTVHRRGVMQYDEIDTTGVLLPISLQFRKIFERNDQLLKTL